MIVKLNADIRYNIDRAIYAYIYIYRYNITHTQVVCIGKTFCTLTHTRTRHSFTRHMERWRCRENISGGGVWKTTVCLGLQLIA